MRWWISFANETGNLGFTIAEGDSPEIAIQNCINNKCHPQGEAMILPIMEEIASKNEATYLWLNSLTKYRLFQKSDVPSFAGATNVEQAKKEGWFPTKEARYSHQNCLCARCRGDKTDDGEN